MSDLIELRRRIHKLAIEKGWWETGDRPWREIRMLVVSEIAEALEEYRAGRMKVWYSGNERPDNPTYSKPEGFPVELADAAIRLLGYAERIDSDWDANDITYIVDGDADGVRGSVPMQLDRLVEHLHCDDYEVDAQVWIALSSCFDVAIRNGIDLVDVIELKHKYNETRPYRHGGKRA
jgi:hypothetical protein